MIRAVVAKNTFGGWLRSARLATIDPTTGNPYTQERLGELMQISGSKVAAWERGQIVSISPADAHLLSSILKVSVKDILEAIGYEVDDAPLLDDERELLSQYRRLRDVPSLQQAVMLVARGLPASQGPETPTALRRRRPNPRRP